MSLEIYDIKGAQTIMNQTFNFADRAIVQKDLKLVYEIIRMYPKLSRTELAATICEALDWVTHTQQPKTSLGMELLDKLEEETEDLVLPAKRKNKPRKTSGKMHISFSSRTNPKQAIVGKLAALDDVIVQMAENATDHSLWAEYVHRYHPLGYKQSFGAQQRYFICCTQGYLGCLLFSASAWALDSRDTWIGWNIEDRKQRLHLVVNNSRFLIFPWVTVKNLASKVLSLVSRRIQTDWENRYGYRPVLLETFVDTEKYLGTCYRAANWHYLGETAGRGRMDRYHKNPSTAKRIYVYPLQPNFRETLQGEVSTDEAN